MPRRSVSLFRRIERALETIALGSTPVETIHQTANFLSESFSDDLGIKGGRIYSQDDGSYELVETFGDVVKAPIGLRVWRTYPPFDELIQTGATVMARDDERLDQRLEEEYGLDRMTHVIRAARHLDPVAIIDRIFTDVSTYSGNNPPADDQTVVVVGRRSGQPEEAPA